MSTYPNKPKRGHKRLNPDFFRKIARSKASGARCRKQPSSLTANKPDNVKLAPAARSDNLASSKPEWSVIRLIDEQDGTLSLLFRFPGGQGTERTLELGNDLSTNEMCRKLRSYTPTLPRIPKEAIDHIENLIDTAPIQPIIKVRQPGWKMVSPPDEGPSRFQPQAFAVPGQIIPSSCDQLLWATIETGPRLGQTLGSLQQWNKLVARFSQLSSYIAFAGMTALASTLLPFAQLLEGAVFNIVGESSTGKTTALKAGMSVQGHPRAFHHWDTTPRTLEEQAAAHNHVLFGMEAAERNMGKDRRQVLKRMFHGVPDGQSMSRSQEVQDRFQNLSWSNFTLCTSNKTGAQMAAELGLEWAEQEQVRFIDIPVPKAHQGGIFDRLDSSTSNSQARPDRLIQQLEAALSQNYGVLLGPWIEHLLKMNPTSRVQELTERFLKKVKPKPGIEERIARKFALVYAAGRIAVEAGLLAWPEDYSLKVTLRLYWRAHRLRTAGSKDLQRDLLRLRQMLHDPAYAPKAKAGQMIENQSEQSLLGVHTVHKGVPVVAIRQEGVAELFGSSAEAVIKWLRTSGVVMEGHGSRSGRQLAIRLVLGGSVIAKPRFLVLDLQRLEKALSNFLQPG